MLVGLVGDLCPVDPPGTYLGFVAKVPCAAPAENDDAEARERA